MPVDGVPTVRAVWNESGACGVEQKQLCLLLRRDAPRRCSAGYAAHLAGAAISLVLLQLWRASELPCSAQALPLAALPPFRAVPASASRPPSLRVLLRQRARS